MGQPESARSDRVLTCREPGAGRAAQGQATAADGRTAAKAGHPGQGTGPPAVGRGGYHRDAGYDLGVAPEAHRAEVDPSAKGSRAAADGEESRTVGAPHG